jgi:RNA polymerase-binding transcription factor DksA
MNGFGKDDDASELTLQMAENEIHRIQQVNALRSARQSATHCSYCDEPIPQARRLAVPGVQFCVEHQDSHDVDITRPRMLIKML